MYWYRLQMKLDYKNMSRKSWILEVSQPYASTAYYRDSSILPPWSGGLRLHKRIYYVVSHCFRFYSFQWYDSA
jgi:hypothetical protein